MPTETWGKHNFKENGIFYFNNNPDNKTKNITDITKYFGYGSISGLKALSVCKYLGYKKIYFIGLDNNHWNNIKVNHQDDKDLDVEELQHYILPMLLLQS